MKTLLKLALALFVSCPLLGYGQTVTYYHTDALGTPIAITDSTGTLVSKRDYEPYGRQLGLTHQDGPGFTGHVADSSTGLVYMQQRYYDPAIGRFLSVDPVTALQGGPQHFNRYDYAYNNPYKFTDPDGRCGACDRFNDQYASDAAAGNSGVYAPFVKPAMAVAIAALPLAPAARGLVGLVRTAVAVLRRQEAPTQGSQPKGDLHAPGDVPNGNVVVRGGTGEMPAPGTVFSGSQGRSVEEAGAGVPHGTIRTSTAGEIRTNGGRVDVAPEPTRSGQVNGQHVNVTEGQAPSSFGSPQPNPVPKPERIQ